MGTITRHIQRYLSVGKRLDNKGIVMIVYKKDLTNKTYADLASYCNHNDCHIEDKGEYLESVKNEYQLPTDEQQRQNRAIAYKAEVDPITSHIQRLRDEEELDEEKIAELIAERNAKVEEIKERYPYYEEQKDAIEEG